MVRARFCKGNLGERVDAVPPTLASRETAARHAKVMQINDSFSDCMSHEVGAGVEAKLLPDPILVKGHGARRNVQDAGRLLHGSSFCQQLN